MSQVLRRKLAQREAPSGNTARELVSRGAVLLDVRTAEEFASEHVDGALNVPLQELALRFHEIGPPQRPVVVYCRSGRRSSEAARLLKEAGFMRVHDMGAMLAWTTADPIGT